MVQLNYAYDVRFMVIRSVELEGQQVIRVMNPEDESYNAFWISESEVSTYVSAYFDPDYSVNHVS